MKPALALLAALFVAAQIYVVQRWEHRPTRHYEVTIDSLTAANKSQFTALRGAVEMASIAYRGQMIAEGKLNQAGCW